MGASSPHCFEPGTRGRKDYEDGLARSAFSRGYPSKRSGTGGGYQNGGFYNGGAYRSESRGHGKANSRGEYYAKGGTMLFRILVAAVTLWILFQVLVVLEASVAKHSDFGDTPIVQLSWSLLNASSVPKSRASVVKLQRQNWSALRPPRIALVCPHLGARPDSLFLFTLAKALQLLDYEFELYGFMDGSLHYAWKSMGIPVTLFNLDPKQASLVDWSRFEGVLAFSFGSVFILSSILQEPFKQIPLVWTLHECGPLNDSEKPNEQRTLKHLLHRSKAVVFPNILQASCAPFYAGNFLAVPGSPFEVWEAEKYMLNNDRQSARLRFGLNMNDFAVALGSSNSNDIWRAHAMVMHAVRMKHEVKLFIIASSDSHPNYEVTLKAMASQLGLLNRSVNFVEHELTNEIIWAADVFVYVSVAEETFFPPILIRAMAFERIVVAPASQALQHHILDGVNGFLYSKEDYGTLADRLQALRQSEHYNAQIASAARKTARSLFAREAAVGYAELLEAVVEFPSEVSIPKSPSSIPSIDWDWNLVDKSMLRSDVEKASNADQNVFVNSSSSDFNGSDRSYDEIDEDDIAQEKLLQLMNDLERVEEEEVEERREQNQATFEDVNRGVKKAEREKFEFHERDDGELERTGQPLCIYEPYYGYGAWPFLHTNCPLYRGLSLSSRGRRPKSDDVDAVSRLPLLNDTYYRNILCEFGGFLAIANRVDRIHKNSWIGFQPWSASGRKVGLSQQAETSLVDAIKSGAHGDAVFFWVRSEVGNASADFWSMCDARNAGNCRRVFLDTFKRMYGVESAELPVMPAGSWAAMHSWAMHTSSFMEFVLFSRMFLDSLDALLYIEHHNNGKCLLASTSRENQECYCRLLEHLVNVWAYHSARRLIYVDPQTGAMKEQQHLESRRGLMKIKWFGINVLKGMDEDMAEKADDEHPNHRWLWPHTGEVFWQGILEREKQERYNLKLEKKRRNKERLARMRSRYKQKSLGRYVKPPPGAGYVSLGISESNDTTSAST